VGLLNRTTLEEAIALGKEDITEIMTRKFPLVSTVTPVENIFPLCQLNQAIAVVDDQEKLMGTIQTSDILNNLSPIAAFCK
jgi:predicted transcriptional regulator